MIRRWFGKCETRHHVYRAIPCKLKYGHDGEHHFGWFRTRHLAFNLDAPLKTVGRPPTEPAMPPKGPGGVSTTHCCCRCHRETP